MKVLVIIAAILVVAHADSMENQWHEFKETHGKTYKSFMEEMSRFIIFQDNVREIEEHNQKFAKGEVSYTKGINQFSDMTQEEFDATLAPLTPLPSSFSDNEFNVSEELGADEDVGGDQEVDWVKTGFVRNQEGCASCWAFIVVGTIERQVMKKQRKLVMVSPQNSIDCAREGNKGCKGGVPEYAFRYVMKNGIRTEEEYPYIGRQEECQMKGGQKITRYVRLPNDEGVLSRTLYTKGPIVIALDAKGLKGYKNGVIDAFGECTKKVNHAVILVGSGIENGKKYWLAKNYWGNKWGDNGYFKILRGVRACGVGTMCTYPQL